MNGLLWKKEEIDTLIELYCSKGLSLSEIVPFISRSSKAIKLKIKRLKLRHTPQQTKDIKSRLNMGKNNSMFGKVSPHKGLNKYNCEWIMAASQKLSKSKKDAYANGTISTKGKKNGMFGKSTWRKNQTKDNNEKVRLAGMKCSITKKQQWQLLSEEEKNRRRKQWGLQGLKCPKKSTKIEIIIKNILDSKNISYKTQQPIDRWSVDFLLDNGKIIECFGDYWHCNPQRYSSDYKLTEAQQKNIKRDKEKISYFEKENRNYLILWETEILNKTAFSKLESFLK